MWGDTANAESIHIPFSETPCRSVLPQRWGDTSKEAGTAQGPALKNQQSHPCDAAPDLTIPSHQGNSVEVHSAGGIHSFRAGLVSDLSPAAEAQLSCRASQGFSAQNFPKVQLPEQ